MTGEMMLKVAFAGLLIWAFVWMISLIKEPFDEY